MLCMDVELLGETLRRHRKGRRLTQSQLASAAGVSRLTVDKLENGRAAEIGLSKAVRLLAALDLTLEVRPRPRRPTLEDLTAHD